MTVKIIKEQLKGQEMATNGGRNQVLADRLIDAVCHNVPLVENQNEEIMDNFSGSGFNAGEYWKYFDPEEHSEIINKASHNIASLQFRAPAVPEAESRSKNIPKRDFKQTLDLPPFILYVLKPKINSRGGLVIAGIEGEFVYDRVLSDKSLTNIEYLHQYSINLNPHPSEWYALIITIKRKRQDNNIKKCTIEDIRA